MEKSLTSRIAPRLGAMATTAHSTIREETVENKDQEEETERIFDMSFKVNFRIEASAPIKESDKLVISPNSLYYVLCHSDKIEVYFLPPKGTSLNTMEFAQKYTKCVEMLTPIASPPFFSDDSSKLFFITWNQNYMLYVASMKNIRIGLPLPILASYDLGINHKGNFKYISHSFYYTEFEDNFVGSAKPWCSPDSLIINYSHSNYQWKDCFLKLDLSAIENEDVKGELTLSAENVKIENVAGLESKNSYLVNIPIQFICPHRIACLAIDFSSKELIVKTFHFKTESVKTDNSNIVNGIITFQEAFGLGNFKHLETWANINCNSILMREKRKSGDLVKVFEIPNYRKRAQENNVKFKSIVPIVYQADRTSFIRSHFVTDDSRYLCILNKQYKVDVLVALESEYRSILSTQSENYCITAISETKSCMLNLSMEGIMKVIWLQTDTSLPPSNQICLTKPQSTVLPTLTSRLSFSHILTINYCSKLLMVTESMVAILQYSSLSSKTLVTIEQPYKFTKKPTGIYAALISDVDKFQLTAKSNFAKEEMSFTGSRLLVILYKYEETNGSTSTSSFYFDILRYSGEKIYKPLQKGNSIEAKNKNEIVTLNNNEKVWLTQEGILLYDETSVTLIHLDEQTKCNNNLKNSVYAKRWSINNFAKDIYENYRSQKSGTLAEDMIAEPKVEKAIVVKDYIVARVLTSDNNSILYSLPLQKDQNSPTQREAFRIVELPGKCRAMEARYSQNQVIFYQDKWSVVNASFALTDKNEIHTHFSALRQWDLGRYLVMTDHTSTNIRLVCGESLYKTHSEPKVRLLGIRLGTIIRWASDPDHKIYCELCYEVNKTIYVYSLENHYLLYKIDLEPVSNEVIQEDIICNRDSVTWVKCNSLGALTYKVIKFPKRNQEQGILQFYEKLFATRVSPETIGSAVQKMCNLITLTNPWSLMMNKANLKAILRMDNYEIAKCLIKKLGLPNVLLSYVFLQKIFKYDVAHSVRATIEAIEEYGLKKGDYPIANTNAMMSVIALNYGIEEPPIAQNKPKLNLMALLLMAPMNDIKVCQVKNHEAPIAKLEIDTNFVCDPGMREHVYQAIKTLIRKRPKKSRTFRVYRSLFEFSLNNGSEVSRKLMAMLPVLSPHNLKTTLRPMVYMKWNKIFYWVLGYATLFWAGSIFAYIFYLDTSQTGWGILLMIVLLLLGCFELKCCHSDFVLYFRKAYNYVDCFNILFNTALTFFMLTTDPDHGPFANWLMLIGLSILWIRGMTWLRVFRHTRYLITMFLRVFYDFLPFLAILVAAVFLFAFVWKMSPELDLQAESVGTFYEALIESTMVIFGSTPTLGDKKTGIRFVLSVIGSVSLALVLGNFLIAIINGTFERINSERDYYDVMELLEIISDFEAFLTLRHDDAGSDYNYFCSLVEKYDEDDIDYSFILPLTDRLESLEEKINHMISYQETSMQKMYKKETQNENSLNILTHNQYNSLVNKLFDNPEEIQMSMIDKIAPLKQLKIKFDSKTSAN